jgi:NAD(P)-dependent dehydrogenase (short-subunit alcohol dehydrogenase family)
MKRLEGKVALITGAAQGIGAGISRVLATHGAVVALTDVSESVIETAEALREEGLTTHGCVMDVTDGDQVDGVVEEVIKEHGKIDILVNNAGIYPRRRLVEMDDIFMTRMFEINVFGMFRCARSVLPGMMERRYGKIVNMSSVTGPMVGTPAGGQTAYAATKSAVQGFTIALALETAQYGINVNCVMPGEDSVGASGDPGGGGRAGAIPRIGRVPLHHGGQHGHRRREHPPGGVPRPLLSKMNNSMWLTGP